MRIVLILSVILMASSLYAGTADVREIQPTLVLKSGEAGQWFELTTQWNATEFSDRRLVVSRLNLDLDLPSGTGLELWATRADTTLPWVELGAVPVDRWVMDARTGNQVRFNIQGILAKALGKGHSNVKLYLKVDEHQAEDIRLTVEAISNLKVEVRHRPISRD